MRWLISVATSLLLASHVSASVRDIRVIIGRGESERGMRRYASSMVEPVAKRDQSAPTNGNLTLWVAQTVAACSTALAMLNGVASNPSGFAMCYNIPFLDRSTGVFQADLQLYKIASPTGDFTSMPDQDIDVNLAYLAASFSVVDPSYLTPTKRSVVSLAAVRRDSGLAERQSGPVTLQQSYAVVGQINKNLVAANLNSSALQAILLPIVTLTGKTLSGATVQTTLSQNEASFVTGQFSDQPKTAASLSAAEVIATVPFVLPGTKILIFPIGAVITVTWAVLGISTVAYGTIGRMRFNALYHRRVNRAMGKMKRPMY